MFKFLKKKSFEALDSWKEEFILQGCPKDKETFPFVIIGSIFFIFHKLKSSMKII